MENKIKFFGNEYTQEELNNRFDALDLKWAKFDERLAKAEAARFARTRSTVNALPKFQIGPNEYSNTPVLGGNYSHVPYTVEEEKRVRALQLWFSQRVKTRKAQKAKPLYWRLDNTIYKDGVEQTIKKYVCVVDVDNPEHYVWKDYTYNKIAQSPYYGSCKVKLSTGDYTVKECIEEIYPKYKAKVEEASAQNDFSRAQKIILAAASLKKKLDHKLDVESRRFAKQTKDALYTPEKQIAMLDEYESNPENNRVIACYPIKDSAYKGEINKTQCGRLQITKFTDIDGRWLCNTPTDDGGFIIGTNRKVEFDTLVCNTAYKNLYNLIEIGDAFEITPRTVEGFWRLDSFNIVRVDKEEEEIIKRPEGIFGYVITKDAYEEFNVLVNNYKGLADSGLYYQEGDAEREGIDLSDEEARTAGIGLSPIVNLRHLDGVRSLRVTKYWCYKNPDKVAEYREIPLKDFQYEEANCQSIVGTGDYTVAVPKHYTQRHPVDEYEATADVLDDVE